VRRLKKQYIFQIVSIFLWGILFSNIGNTSNKSSEIKVEAFISKYCALIGDQLDYSLSIKTDPSLKVKVEDIKIFNDYEVIKIDNIKEIIENDIKTISLRYTFTVLKAGAYLLPSISIKYGRDKLNHVTKSGQIPFLIKTLLNKDENDIRDIVHFASIKKSSDLKKYIFLALVIILLIIIFLFIKKRKKDKISVSEIPSPAWEIAFKELDALVKKDFLKQEKFKEFYYELSFILRKYIENQFQVMAPERTTEEFIKIMQSQNIFTISHQKLLKDFLLTSDLVKFAKRKPDSKEIDEGSFLVRTFIEDTMEKENISEDKK